MDQSDTLEHLTLPNDSIAVLSQLCNVQGLCHNLQT